MRKILTALISILIVFLMCFFLASIDSIIEQDWLSLFIIIIIVLLAALRLIAPPNFIRDIARKLFDDDEL